MFREFLWLSKRNSRTISEHRERSEELKRTIRTNITTTSRPRTVKSENDEVLSARKVEDEIVKFLLGKVGFLKGESERSDDERTSRARKTTTRKSQRKRNIDDIRAPTRGVSEHRKDTRGIERRAA